MLARVHASRSDLFDRRTELSTFRAVSSAGLGPRLLMLFGNGRVEQFLEGYVTLTSADIRHPVISQALAASLACFHLTMVRTPLLKPCIHNNNKNVLA